jgi:hypothetical protein
MPSFGYEEVKPQARSTWLAERELARRGTGGRLQASRAARTLSEDALSNSQDNETTFSTFCEWELFLFTSSINQLIREILHVKFLLTSMRIPLLPPAIPFFAFVSDTSLRWLPHHAFTRGRTRGFVTHDNAAFHARPHVYTKIPFPTKVLFHTNHSFYMSVVWAACG